MKKDKKKEIDDNKIGLEELLANNKTIHVMACLILAVFLPLSLMGGCGKLAPQVDNGKLNVVSTIFPSYDFLRQIAGDRINLSMLLKPGAEVHGYEPTPQEIKKIADADLFVYVGGDSDEWVNSILESIGKDRRDKMTVIKMMDCVKTVQEEFVEGMTPEHEDHTKDHTSENYATENHTTENHATESHATENHTADGHTTEKHTADGHTPDHNPSEEHAHEGEYDEHVWTSPKNAGQITQKLSEALCRLDAVNKGYYEKNTKEYVGKLEQLDQKFREIVQNAKRKEIIMGDRFPFRYFVEEYGLTYYAAFPGCASQTEPSAETIAFLTDKVKEDGIPVVFHEELSNAKVCNSICEATGAKSELLHAVHNVTDKDFKAGATYIDLMEHNAKVLKEALN